MAEVGSFGNITFFTGMALDANGQQKSLKALSFSDFTREDGANFEEHPRFKKKPYLEFTGATVETASMTIELNAHLGYDPWETQNKLLKMCRKGLSGLLMIGGHRIGDNLWYIKNISSAYKEYLADGRLVASKMTLDLIEAPGTQKKAKRKAKQKKSKTNISVAAAGKTYTVTVAANLWTLATLIYGSGSKYKKLMRLNGITSPNSIVAAGTVLVTEV